MAGGGGGVKKLIINTVLDYPAYVYVGGGAALWAIRKLQTAQTYNKWFGKIDFERRKERKEI